MSIPNLFIKNDKIYHNNNFYIKVYQYCFTIVIDHTIIHKIGIVIILILIELIICKKKNNYWF